LSSQSHVDAAEIRYRVDTGSGGNGCGVADLQREAMCRIRSMTQGLAVAADRTNICRHHRGGSQQDIGRVPKCLANSYV
jgi:hypothetical protein